MAHVEVAAGIFPIGVRAVGRNAGARAEIPVRADLVECVRIGVAGDHAETVEVARRECGLQAVVVRTIDVAHLVNLGEEGELGVVGSRGLLRRRVRAAGASGEAGCDASGDCGWSPACTCCGLVDVPNAASRDPWSPT